jgi:hypothetical protein
MSITPTGDDSMNSDDRRYDDVTVIKGIREKRQRTLKEKFRVSTLQDLANISDETTKAVAKALNGVSAEMVRGWSVEAREKLSLQRAVEQANSDPAGEANSPATRGEWKSSASFVVVFQARQMQDGTRQQRVKAHHKEADRHAIWPHEGEEWPGLESTQPWEWMVEQLGERVEPVPTVEEEPPVEARPAESPPLAVPQARLQVTQIRAFQPAQAETPIGTGRAGDLFRGTVQGSEPFALEASFELVETTGAELARERGTYRAKFYARNRSTGECIHLNDTEPQPLVGNKSPHTAKLPGATLPPGNYKLQVLVQLECLPPILGYLEVPLLQVV